MQQVRKEPSGCWIWLGAVSDGLPVVKVHGKLEQVRRRSWPRCRGPVPRKIRASCGQKLCVRPAHLIATRSGPPPKPALEPDEIVLFMQENPSGHKECMRRFRLSEADLIEILDSYYSSVPRADAPTETAPRRGTHKVKRDDSFELALAQLLESSDELW